MTAPESPSPPLPAPTTIVARTSRRRWGYVIALAAVLAAAASSWYALRNRDPFPLMPIAPSPFLNSRPGVAYVGSSACIACHKDEHASFHQTGMGASTSAVDPRTAPPDGAFDHPRSKRRYESVRKDGAVWHREWLHAAGAAPVLLAEYPVKYAVGSGRHALTYLVEADGFLLESPITWYASRKRWDMSPGYDEVRSPGFTRAIGEGCLYCHVSQSEAVGGTTHRMHIGEMVIGCERCHGPGALHVARQSERQRAGNSAEDAVDYTIVNPIHLDRDRAEGICQQCHLNSDAAVLLRGRKLTDYRPGLRFQDFHQVYVFADADKSMTVVGHVEQMHLSRCYQKSSKFSCLTCHDPHDDRTGKDRMAHYRAVCLVCHQREQCTVDAAHRQRESPGNDCIHCHMPRSSTDIPHLAFTHHRVGIHRTAPAFATDAGHGTELRPFLDQPGLSAIDRKLSLGEGYRLLSIRDKDPERQREWRVRGYELLSEVHAAGLRDGDLEAGLAQLSFDMKLDSALAYAQSALAHPDLAGQSRCNALSVVAQVQGKRGKHAEAVAALRELTQLRRYDLDWLFLAGNTRLLGDEAAATEAVEMGARINPRQWKVHRYLADYFDKQGDAARATWHKARAVP